jgi:hypothetical protein
LSLSLNRFEYLSVLVSIVIGLGLSEMIACWAHLLRHRRTVQFYWIHTLWTVMMVLMIVQFWWGFWQFSIVENWSFVRLMAVVVEVIVLVLAATVLTPAREADTLVDLRTYYESQSQLFFALATGVIVLLILVDWLVGGQPPLHAENAVRVPAIVLLAALAGWSKPAFHATAVVVAYVLFLTFVMVQYAR